MKFIVGGRPFGGHVSYIAVLTALLPLSGCSGAPAGDAPITFVLPDGGQREDGAAITFEGELARHDGRAVIEAELADTLVGVTNYGLGIGGVDEGDRLGFTAVDFGPERWAGTFVATAATPRSGGHVQVRLGDTCEGDLVADLTLISTGSYSHGRMREHMVTLSAPLGGQTNISICFVGGAGIANFDSFEFRPGNAECAANELTHWVGASNGSVPANAWNAGTATSPMYLCRALHQGVRRTGYLLTGGGCRIPSPDGSFQAPTAYQVLTSEAPELLEWRHSEDGSVDVEALPGGTGSYICRALDGTDHRVGTLTSEGCQFGSRPGVPQATLTQEVYEILSRDLGPRRVGRTMSVRAEGRMSARLGIVEWRYVPTLDPRRAYNVTVRVTGLDSSGDPVVTGLASMSPSSSYHYDTTLAAEGDTTFGELGDALPSYVFWDQYGYLPSYSNVVSQIDEGDTEDDAKFVLFDTGEVVPDESLNVLTQAEADLERYVGPNQRLWAELFVSVAGAADNACDALGGTDSSRALASSNGLTALSLPMGNLGRCAGEFINVVNWLLNPRAWRAGTELAARAVVAINGLRQAIQKEGWRKVLTALGGSLTQNVGRTAGQQIAGMVPIVRMILIVAGSYALFREAVRHVVDCMEWPCPEWAVITLGCQPRDEPIQCDDEPRLDGSPAPCRLVGAGTCVCGPRPRQPDVCNGVVCSSPPANVCLDSNTIRSYYREGVCRSSDLTCEYVYNDLECQNGCANGACIGPQPDDPEQPENPPPDREPWPDDPPPEQDDCLDQTEPGCRDDENRLHLDYTGGPVPLDCQCPARTTQMSLRAQQPNRVEQVCCAEGQAVTLGNGVQECCTNLLGPRYGGAAPAGVWGAYWFFYRIDPSGGYMGTPIGSQPAAEIAVHPADPIPVPAALSPQERRAFLEQLYRRHDLNLSVAPNIDRTGVWKIAVSAQRYVQITSEDTAERRHTSDGPRPECPSQTCAETVCTDESACTTDTCVDGASGASCVFTAIDIDDSNSCTADACDPVTGVTHTPIPNCNNNNNGGGTCDVNSLVGTWTAYYYPVSYTQYGTYCNAPPTNLGAADDVITVTGTGFTIEDDDAPDGFCPSATVSYSMAANSVTRACGDALNNYVWFAFGPRECTSTGATRAAGELRMKYPAGPLQSGFETQCAVFVRPGA